MSLTYDQHSFSTVAVSGQFSFVVWVDRKWLAHATSGTGEARIVYPLSTVYRIDEVFFSAEDDDFGSQRVRARR